MNLLYNQNHIQMLILGLTGGIATGKSTVSNYFADKYEIPIIDADKIAKEVVEPNTPSYDAIVKHFSPSIPGLTVGVNGPLNRTVLGAYVFANKDELKVLNSITHPAVRKRIMVLIISNYIQKKPVVILDIPLLFESGMDWLCSRVLTVVCNSDKQLARLLERNPELTREQAIGRINAQMPLSQKVALSDFTIENDGTLEDLKRNIDVFVSLYLLALDTNKSKFMTYFVNRFWNWLQAIFPPFAAMGSIVALLRKGIQRGIQKFSIF